VIVTIGGVRSQARLDDGGQKKKIEEEWPSELIVRRLRGRISTLPAGDSGNHNGDLRRPSATTARPLSMNTLLRRFALQDGAQAGLTMAAKYKGSQEWSEPSDVRRSPLPYLTTIPEVGDVTPPIVNVSGWLPAARFCGTTTLI
jgi:hypothetical protein